MGYLPNFMADEGDCLQKLGQLEDIEDELGVDLSVYLKVCALGRKIYVKFQGEVLEMKVVHKLVYDSDLEAFGFFAPPDGGFIPRFKMSEYGKTWALSKDELNK
jgi:hypothetical protein